MPALPACPPLLQSEEASGEQPDAYHAAVDRLAALLPEASFAQVPLVGVEVRPHLVVEVEPAGELEVQPSHDYRHRQSGPRQLGSDTTGFERFPKRRGYFAKSKYRPVKMELSDATEPL